MAGGAHGGALLLWAFAAALALPGSARAGEGETAATGQATAEEPSDPELLWRDVIALLHETRKVDAAPVAELAARASRGVAANLDRTLGVLHEGKAPPLGDEAPLRLSAPQRELLALALATLPREPVVFELERLLGEQADQRARRLRLFIEGCVGRVEELPKLFALALCPEESELSPALAEELRPALAKLILRQPGATIDWLGRHWIGLARPLAQPLVLALGDTDRPESVDCLASIAGQCPELTFLALAKIRSIGSSGNEEVDRRVIEIARRAIDPSRPDRSQTALQVLGELGDFGSADFLIDLLDDDQRGIGEAAHWALQRMSTLRLPANADIWRHWYKEERRWAMRERERTLEALSSRKRETAVEAAHEIARHLYDRHTLAERCAAALEHPDPLVRRAVCQTLTKLGSRRALPALAEAFDDLDEGVAAAAKQTYLALGGVEPAAPDLLAGR